MSEARANPDRRGDAPEIGVGVIGAGRWAVDYHLPALVAVDGVRLVAVANRTTESARRVAARFGIPHVFADYRQVLDRPDVHAVGVFTHYDVRREVILAACAAGKHVLAQKPLAASAAEGAELVTASRRAGVRLVTSFMHNYFPETVLAKRLLDEGAIGALRLIRQRNATHNTYDRALELRGAAWDIGPHGVALIHHLAGQRIVRVQALLDALTRPPERRDERDGRPVDTLALMHYTLSDGTLASHEVQWTAKAGTLVFSTELFGDRGGLLLRPHSGSGPLAVARMTDGSDPTGRAAEWEFLPVPPERTRGLLHHQLFIDDVRYSRHDSAAPEVGLAALRVLEAAYRSAREARAVDVAT